MMLMHASCLVSVFDCGRLSGRFCCCCAVALCIGPCAVPSVSPWVDYALYVSACFSPGWCYRAFCQLSGCLRCCMLLPCAWPQLPWMLKLHNGFHTCHITGCRVGLLAHPSLVILCFSSLFLFSYRPPLSFARLWGRPHSVCHILRSIQEHLVRDFCCQPVI